MPRGNKSDNLQISCGQSLPQCSASSNMLGHQVLKQPEAKNLSKTAQFDQKRQILSVFLALASLKIDGRASNP